MKNLLKLFAVAILLVLILIGAAVGWALATEHRPADLESVAVECTGDGTQLKAGQPFTVLSWNLQYAASRKHRFFYDGGNVVHVPQEDVTQTVAAISRVIDDSGAAVVLLQEIDRDSDRTGNIDQLPPYVTAAKATCHAAAPYHKSPFVPNPPDDFLGRVDMELGTLTRGPMLHANRIQLPLLDEPRWRQVFNLKRAVLTSEIPIEGWPQPLAVANTHLSAFSHGDGTLSRQVAALRAWIDARPEGQPWIVAGDFNLLPPGFDKTQLTSERDLYADADNPIDQLLPRFTDVLGDQLAPKNRTYLPYGAIEPDRKIDYMIIGGPLRVEAAEVLSAHNQISDHLPIQATLVVTDEKAATDTPPSATPPSARDILKRAEDAADKRIPGAAE